jgi:hypothetical protein
MTEGVTCPGTDDTSAARAARTIRKAGIENRLMIFSVALGISSLENKMPWTGRFPYTSDDVAIAVRWRGQSSPSRALWMP